MHFIDRVTIHVKSGDGGDGLVAFRREKYVPAGGPAGGNGGHGGSVILQATTDLQTLLDFRFENIFKAENGERGGPSNMTGKKGISKLVLRSVLPIINLELQRLLEDVTDFDVEISIDDKNDVKISIVKDDVEKSLKSGSGYELTCASIALRCVLGKMSTLPMPNFIAFDEVLGRVANVNLEIMKPLFDKIRDMFDIVLFITHNEIVKDWSDNIITIVKENNISKQY
jgi:hypothetical protein